MPRSRSLIHHSTGRLAATSCAALPTLIAFSAPVRAHSLLVSSGEAVVDRDKVIVNLEVMAEDFLHYYRLAADGEAALPRAMLDDASERHGEELTRVLVLRDGQGAELSGRVTVVRPDWSGDSPIPPRDLRRYRVHYTLHFDAPTSPRFLTFRIRIDAAWSPVLSQTVLAMRGAGQREVTILRLTSRGNAETIELSHGGEGTRILAGARALATETECVAWYEAGAMRFRELFAEIRIAEGDIESRVVVPVPLLATWITPVQTEPDSLSVSEQAAIRPAVQELLKSAMIAECDGAVVPVELSDFRFLPIEPQIAGNPQSRRSIDLWTGRVEARLHFAAPAQAGPVTLRWALFNNAVLSARANITVDARCREHVFTTYDPVFTWRRG